MSSNGGSGMIRTILIVVLVLFLIGVALFWIITGGLSRAWQTGKSFTNPIALIFGNGTTTGVFIRLPWQPEQTRGPDISDYVGIADQQVGDAGGTEELQARLSYLQQFGTPSPYAGAISIAGGNAAARDPSLEHVVLRASGATPVTITGWALQSAVSGVRGVIPPAAPVFVAGVVNNVQAVTLQPGAAAIVTTGPSPVGVSFEESKCTGYLNQLQAFSPALNESCPAPTDALPQTAETLRTYGASCFDFVADLPSCYFAGAEMPASLSPACRSYVANNLSYNGCVAMYGNDASFLRPAWRLYLARSPELWNNSHDIIRLLDEQGRVVDVLSY